MRDSNGTTLQNTNVSFQFSIVEDSLQGNVLFTEQHVSVQTNEFGIINLVIGSGSAILNTLNGVDWSNPPHFVKIGLDISGGTSFTDMGGFGFYTVPYAYHSVTSDSALNDFDRDPNNELQTIILLGDSINLSNGGGVNLSHLNDTTAIKDLEALLNQKVAEIKSKSTSVSILFVGVTDSLKSKMVKDSLTIQAQLGNLNSQIDVTDRDSTNEIQTFSLVNDTLRLSKTTGEISFKGYFDNTDSQNLTLVDDTLLVISGSNDTISVGRFNH